MAAATAALFPGAVSLAQSYLPDGNLPPGAPALSEPRAYVFDYSALDLRHHELFLVAGRQRLQLDRISKKDRQWLREQYPVLELVPDERMTHWILAHFPAEAVQFCYIRRIHRKYLNQGQGKAHGRAAGVPWDWVGQFDHLPTQALLEAEGLIRRSLADVELRPVPSKWKRLGLTAAEIEYLNDPIGLDTLKTSDDTACSMVSKHPELASGDPTSAAYVSQSIVAPQTGSLAGVIDTFNQPQYNGCSPQQNWSGCGSPIVQNDASWGTLVPVCNPDTHEQAVGSDGALTYVPIYSDATNQAAAGAITGSLQQVKSDTSLGANTSSDPTQQAGTLYRYSDGVTTSDQTLDGLGAGNGLSYTTKEFSPGQGFTATVIDVEESATDGVVAEVTVKVDNWYVRYLGLYVVYLDANGKTLTSFSADFQAALADEFPLRSPDSVGHDWDANDALFLNLLGPEKEILGMPTGDTVMTLKLPMPEEATSLLLLASGMGTTAPSSNAYNGTATPGATMTGVFELALPTFFLALNAASGLTGLKKGLEETSNVLSIVPLVLETFADFFEAIGFDDPDAFESIAVSIGQMLLTSGATNLVKFVVSYLTEGETEQDLLDAIPVVGGFLAMIAAIGTLAQIAETSTQVLQSPTTYKFEVTLTHDIDVVIAGDPNNAGSWPSTATHFKVVLLFDGGTPTQLVQDLPGTTVQSQTASFQAVPLGGMVTVSVQVYSDTGYQVAKASAGPYDNLDPGGPLTLDLQLTQEQVPLTADTVYSHKEVTALNASGDHVWEATTIPPTQEPAGCTPASGQLCELTGITVNTTAGAVGQSFQSANDAVGDCTSGGAGGQTNQFSNISVTGTPQDGYFFSGCGFGAPPRLVYDLVNDPDFNFYLDTSAQTLQNNPGFKGGLIRQIRLSSGNQGFDAPDSNLAWGKLHFPSDALLLHPGRKIVSINATHSKIEVIDLPAAAMPDADAPGSHTHGGKGLREGLMDSPVLAALAPDGAVLVLESNNRRIQAFDLNANPVQRFGAVKMDYYFDLKDQAVGTYLAFAVEFAGYMYVLWKDVAGNQTLDLYDPEGNFLSSTSDFRGQSMTVNYWRDLFTQNAQVLRLPNGDLPARTEPSISHWIPSTP